MSVGGEVMEIDGGDRVGRIRGVTVKLSGAGRGGRVRGVNWSEDVVRGGGCHGNGKGDVDVVVVSPGRSCWEEPMR